MSTIDEKIARLADDIKTEIVKSIENKTQISTRVVVNEVPVYTPNEVFLVSSDITYEKFIDDNITPHVIEGNVNMFNNKYGIMYLWSHVHNLKIAPLPRAYNTRGVFESLFMRMAILALDYVEQFKLVFNVPPNGNRNKKPSNYLLYVFDLACRETVIDIIMTLYQIRPSLFKDTSLDKVKLRAEIVKIYEEKVKEKNPPPLDDNISPVVKLTRLMINYINETYISDFKVYLKNMFTELKNAGNLKLNEKDKVIETVAKLGAALDTKMAETPANPIHVDVVASGKTNDVTVAVYVENDVVTQVSKQPTIEEVTLSTSSPLKIESAPPLLAIEPAKDQSPPPQYPQRSSNIRTTGFSPAASDPFFLLITDNTRSTENVNAAVDKKKVATTTPEETILGGKLPDRDKEKLDEFTLEKNMVDAAYTYIRETSGGLVGGKFEQMMDYLFNFFIPNGIKHVTVLEDKAVRKRLAFVFFRHAFKQAIDRDLPYKSDIFLAIEQYGPGIHDLFGQMKDVSDNGDDGLNASDIKMLMDDFVKVVKKRLIDAIFVEKMSIHLENRQNSPGQEEIYMPKKEEVELLIPDRYNNILGQFGSLGVIIKKEAIAEVESSYDRQYAVGDMSTNIAYSLPLTVNSDNFLELILNNGFVNDMKSASTPSIDNYEQKLNTSPTAFFNQLTTDNSVEIVNAIITKFRKEIELFESTHTKRRYTAAVDSRISRDSCSLFDKRCTYVDYDVDGYDFTHGGMSSRKTMTSMDDYNQFLADEIEKEANA